MLLCICRALSDGTWAEATSNLSDGTWTEADQLLKWRHVDWGGPVT
jgi:hypothetical protein